jgi:hypothetical protein
MRSTALIAAFGLTTLFTLAACAQPAPDGQPPGYGQDGPPPGYGQQGAPPPGYGQGGPPPGYAQQGWAGGMSGAGGQAQMPPPNQAPNQAPSGPPGMPPPRVPMAERFAAANTTHDGRLTQEQAQAAGLHGIARHFQEIDRDRKGYVTMEDIHEWRLAQRAQKMGQQGAPPGPAGYPPAPSGQQY